MVAFLAVAYVVLFPMLGPRSIGRMALYDLAVTAAMLLVNGMLFAGPGTRFSLVLFETNWVVFTLVTAVVIESPLFLWYARRNGLKMD